MVYIQKITPPPNKLFSFSLKDFSGGFNNRSDELENNQASNICNMMFTDGDVMETRFGQKYYDELLLDDEVIFIDEYKPYNDVPVLLRATATKFYIEGTVLTTISGKPKGVNHSGRYYFTDGAKLWVYGRFGQVTSTYEKIIGTAVDDYVLLEVTSPADGHARLDTAHVKGVLNVDYTNFKVFYEPCENEFVDEYKGANKVPINANYIVSHNGRLFVSGVEEDDDNIFITHVLNPFYFPVSLPMQIPPNSDKVVGMDEYDNAVIIGRHHDLYAITGSTNRTDMGVTPFKLIKINSHTGFASSSSFNIAHNYLFFLGTDGNAYSLGSTFTDYSRLSTSIISDTIDFEKEPLNLSLSDLQSAYSKFYQDEWFITIKDFVFVYSYRHKAWTVYKNINACSFYVKDYELIWGKSNGRTAMFDKENFLDFGVPYQSFFYSKRFDMDDATNFNQFREYFLVAHTFSDYPSDISVVFEIDYSDVADRVIVTNKVSVWGKAEWGDRFITRNINESLPFVIGRRGRTLRFKFSCNYEVDGAVATALDLEHYLGKRDGLLVYVTGEAKYYLYVNGVWLGLTSIDLNQRMRIYQVNGDYELRGKR